MGCELVERCRIAVSHCVKASFVAEGFRLLPAQKNGQEFLLAAKFSDFGCAFISLGN
jgi:hypothetical protein